MTLIYILNFPLVASYDIHGKGDYVILSIYTTKLLNIQCNLVPCHHIHRLLYLIFCYKGISEIISNDCFL